MGRECENVAKRYLSSILSAESVARETPQEKSTNQVRLSILNFIPSILNFALFGIIAERRLR